MRIAIMTWFSYDNYGSVLQATAMSRFLESLGHDVKIIRYYPTIASNQSKKYKIVQVLRKVYRKILGHGMYDIVGQVSGIKFSTYRDQNLAFTQVCQNVNELAELNLQYDAFICGSDQIWSPICFDAHYFLDFVSDDKKIIAYAPSIGVSKIENKNIEKEMGHLIERFNHLSLREAQGAHIIGKMIGRDVSVVLDPTFLLSSQEWTDVLSINSKVENYMLAYFLGYNKEHWRKTRELAKSFGLPLKIVPIHKADLAYEGTIISGVSPNEFIELIANADYVCTDSFHGVALSINFKKEFFCFKRFSSLNKENQNSRVHNILHILSLENRLYDGKEISIAKEKIDYDRVFDLLESSKEESKKFLIDALEDVKNYSEKIDLCMGETI